MADDADPSSEREKASAGGGSSGPSPAEFAGSGVQFVVAILLFLYVGKWLDEKFGTEPWLLMVGVLVGAVAGFYSFYRRIMAASKRSGDR